MTSTSGAGPTLFAAGIAVGVALGAAGALLFAPQSGADTRRFLKRRATALQHRSEDVWADLRDELRRVRRRREAARRQRREEAERDLG